MSDGCQNYDKGQMPPRTGAQLRFAEARGSTPTSDNLLEMAMERQPAKWAAHQIAAKSHPEIKTVGDAMNMIEAIVREAIMMDRHQRSLEEAHGVKRKGKAGNVPDQRPGEQPKS